MFMVHLTLADLVADPPPIIFPDCLSQIQAHVARLGTRLTQPQDNPTSIDLLA